MNVAIVGFGLEGKSALHYWQQKGAGVTVCDQNLQAAIPAGVSSQLGPDYLKNLDRFDVIFRSAGINPEIILNENPGVTDKMSSVINEFFHAGPTRNIIGITGTKGKGTTSTLIAKILETAGKEVFLGGNIGVSPFDFINKVTPESWVVLELSSFQLSDLRYSPPIALCLMVVPEHLNWHKDMDDYILAKARLFEHQTTQDLAVYFALSENSRKIASYSKGLKMPYFAEPGAHVENGAVIIANQHICDVDELKLLGEHNWQNVCAALTVVWQITQNTEAIRTVLTNFTGLPHRLEFVRDADGIRFYDDSFGTTPETAQVAIKAVPQPKVLILGGSDKGASFDDLAKTIADENVREVVLIGETAPKIKAALRAQNFTNISLGSDTMEKAVQNARAHAQSGDVVMLSPACASFDMFENYKDRAAQFVAAVKAL